MRLERLRLVNWRGFEQLDLPFHPTLTLLVGENGAGKSAILEAVAVALEGLAGVPFQLPPTTIRAGAVHGTATLWTQLDGRSVTTEVDAQVSHASTNVDWNRVRRHAAVLYGTERAVRDLTPMDPSPREWTEEVMWRTALDRQGVSFDAFFEWIREREDLENERIRDDPAHRDAQLEAVRQAVTAVSGLGPPRVRRGRPPRLGVDKAGTHLFFDQLSSGERALVALAGDIARRLAITYPDVDPPERRGIVLIDEVDQHLHPRLQRDVVGRLRGAFPAVQWIMTTHSPLVAMHVETESVRLLRDFRLVSTPRTEGRDANALLADLFDVPERPTRWQKELDHLATLIDDGRLEDAREKLDELARTFGENDPTIVEKRVLVEMLD